MQRIILLTVVSMSLSVSLIISLGAAGVTNIDLLNEAADVQILSATGVLPLTSVTAGDCNGDGFDDVIMRGHLGTVVTVVFGKENLSGVLQLSESKLPNLMITNLGHVTLPFPDVTVGDINGDDIVDLLIVDEDGLQVFWGRKKWPARIDMRIDKADLRIIAKGKRMPRSSATGLVTTGDINNDGIPDLLFTHTYSPPIPSVPGDALPMKEEWATHIQEVAWIFWGKKSWPKVVDLSKQEADAVITAEQSNPGPHRIRPFRIADLDGDGFGDIIAGAWGDTRGTLDPPVGAPWSRGWFIRGRSHLPRKLELKGLHSTQNLRPPKQRNQELPLVIDAWPQGKFIGEGVYTGDFTGDGIEDVVFPVLKSGDGLFSITRELCLLAGNPDFFHKSGDVIERCSMIVGGASFQKVGPIFSPRPVSGDFNGDGRKDLFLMLEAPDFVWTGLLGRKVFSSTVDIDAEAEVRIQTPIGVLERPGYGSSSAMGDVNGDGKADLLIGDALGGIGPRERGGPGAVHIVLGRDLEALKQ
jgi:FG-GAP-like repeat